MKRGHLVISLGLVVVGLVGVGVALSGLASSPEEWVAGHYRRVSANHRLDSYVYSSAKPPSTVVREVTDAWSPVRRHADPYGYYLRYSDAIVGVTANGGGSRIYVDDPDRGYRRWYGHVGGWWGTYPGPPRGGGPGFGK